MEKCHLNLCVADTGQWEQSAAYCLDVHPGVAAWVKNDHVGLQIRYRKAGRSHNYIPDFLVRLNGGQMLILEVKGQLGDALIKGNAAERWVKAVNREKRYSQWSYHLVRHPADVMALLDEMIGVSARQGHLEKLNKGKFRDARPPESAPEAEQRCHQEDAEAPAGCGAKLYWFRV